MKIKIRKAIICISLSMVLVTGSFTRYVHADSYTTQDLCEAWAQHAATPWRITELFNMVMDVINWDLSSLAWDIYYFGISPRTRSFIENACAMDPSGSDHGGHGGNWGDDHGGHGGYWGDVINSADDDLLNGNNYNYYDDQNHDSTSNYQIINNNDNSVYWTYNNQYYNYNYNFNNTYYNTTNNSYTFNLTNNTSLTYINNYNNTTIIYGGDTTALYYMLPDGSDSYNLTEEEAKNGFKTSLSIDNYQNGYDSASLQFLYHFDNNEYNSAYPANNSISFSKNSINYVAGSTGFGYALSFESPTVISTDTSGLYYSFRFYPLVNNIFNLKINDTDIFERESVIQTTYDYVEWTQTTAGSSETTVAQGSSMFTLSVIQASMSSTPTFPNVTGFTKTTTPWRTLPNNGGFQMDCIYTRQSYTDSTDITTSTNQRTYNIINNKIWSDTGSSLVNYGMWNYIAILLDGSVYINGVDSQIDIDNTDDLELSFGGDSVFYFDEFFGNSVNRSKYSPSMPYDSNIVYSLPATFKNNCILIKSLLSVNIWKFGGYRSSNPTSGDVYVAVDQIGNITSIQQFNGIEWVEVGAGLYNEYLGIWINAIGFNIFKGVWYYQDLNFDTENNTSNTLIKFLTEKFDAVITAIKNISIVNNYFGDDSDIVTNIENDYNISTENDLEVYIDNLIDADQEIDLTAPSWNLPTVGNNISLFAPILSETLKIYDDNNLTFFIVVPLVIGIIGLIL